MTDFSFWQFVFCFCPPETDTKSRTTYVRIEVEVRSSARQRRRSNLHVQWAGSLRCRNKRPCSGSDGYRWPTCSRLWGCGPACRTEHLGREERIQDDVTIRMAQLYIMLFYLPDLHLHTGGYSPKKPDDRHVLVVGPTAMCPGSQRYSTRLPTLKLSATRVPLAGCSGRPHDFGPLSIRQTRRY